MATIAILSPGAMGAAVGGALTGRGHRVVTELEGRSAISRERARVAGLEDTALVEAMARADLVLSILPPAEAMATARRCAAAIGAAGRAPAYADCNAVAPATAWAIRDVLTAAGAPFIDAGIIGGPPRKDYAPTFYVSGPDAAPLLALDGSGIAVKAAGPQVGDASGLKMCYAAVTKGTTALHIAAALAAERLGLWPALKAEFAASQPGVLEAMTRSVPSVPCDSGRWTGEMEEIAATFAALGVTSGFHQGAAAMFELLSRTPFAAETRETVDRDRTIEQALAVYAETLGRI